MFTDIFKTHDVFISYVVEDREVVEALVSKLKEAGLRVWYAREELRAGADIRELVDKGLASSRYGISIISPVYNGHWAVGELFVLIRNKSRFLPVLHQTSLEEASQIHPGLIKIYCPHTHSGIDHVSREILRTIRPRPSFSYVLSGFFSFMEKHVAKLVFLVSLILLCFVGSFYYQSFYPPDDVIESTIRQRISDLQKMADVRLQQDLMENNATSSSMKDVEQVQKDISIKCGGTEGTRKVDFSNAEDHVTSLRGLVNAGIFTSESDIEPPFGLKDFRVYLCHTKDFAKGTQVMYNLYNMEPVHYEVVGTTVKEGMYEVEVQYQHTLRYAQVIIQGDTAPNGKSSRMKFIGSRKQETIVFEKKGKNWALLKTY